MTEQPYDKLTHDEILRVHGELYSRMTPEQRVKAAADAKKRLQIYYAEQRELDSPRNKKLSELTLGEVLDEVGVVADKFFTRIALVVVGYLAVVWIAKYLGLMH